MRIVVDLQACQGRNRRTSIGRYSLALAKSLAREAAGDELWILLAGSSGEAADEVRSALEDCLPAERVLLWTASGDVAEGNPANGWRARANEIVREHFIQALRPDVVHVASLFEGFEDPLVTSIGATDCGFLTSVSVFDADHRGHPDDGVAARLRRSWYLRKMEHLRRADLLFFTSAEKVDLGVLTSRARRVAIAESFERLLAEADGDALAAAATRMLDAMREAVRARSRAVERRSRKLRLAFVSPLPPLRNGIADYSAMILPELRPDYDIDLIVDQPEVSLPEPLRSLPVRDCRWFVEHAQEFDRVLYQMGNSLAHKHMLDLMKTRSGVAVVHDFFLSGLLLAMERLETDRCVFDDALYEAHGYAAVLDRRRFKDIYAVWKYPCSLPVLAAAEGVIVHSNYPKELADLHYGQDVSAEWSVVPHIQLPIAREQRSAARHRLGLIDDEVLVCTFGAVNPSKLPDRILEAWQASRLARDPQCRFVFVGHNMELDLVRQIAKSPVGERVGITGYAAPDLFATYLEACDFAVQLRADTRGETSGAALFCLARGVPTIVNAHGAMADYPEQVVVKLPELFSTAELVEAMERLVRDRDLRSRLSRNALAYVVDVHSPAAVGARYRDAIERQTDVNPLAQRRRIARDVGAIAGGERPTEQDLIDLAATIAARHRSYRPKQFLVDVAAILEAPDTDGSATAASLDLRDRLAQGTAAERIEPVYMDDRGTLRYARALTMSLFGVATRLRDDPVEMGPEDVLVALDALRSSAA